MPSLAARGRTFGWHKRPRGSYPEGPRLQQANPRRGVAPVTTTTVTARAYYPRPPSNVTNVSSEAQVESMTRANLEIDKC